jgi:ppGpp synthetase/RelA/SpoT-type nucleotidyltranferase
MSVMKVKGELEDLAFRVLDPVNFQRCKYTQIAAHKAFYDASEAIQDIMLHDAFLQQQRVTYKLTARVKDKYQLFLKMTRKRLGSPQEVKDALGLRTIIHVPRDANESDADYLARGNSVCYHIVSRLSQLRGWRPGVFKDYIANAKSNGYSSLHLFIRNVALGTNVEVQVRTRDMHVQAELGEAAHWHYKDILYRPEIANSKYYRIAWRSEEQLHAKSSAELIGLAKKQLHATRVFIFLEDQATVLNLKKGATALDAAFAIHSAIGLGTRFINIQGSPVAFQQVLQNGDVVSVNFDRGFAIAQPSWLNLVRLPSSAAIIRRYLREKQQCTVAVLGCVQLLMSLTVNKDAIRTRCLGSFPTAVQLEKYAITRTGRAGLGELLLHLGVSSLNGVSQTISKLVDIPAEELTVFSTTGALLWARHQSRLEGVDSSLRLDILSPLLKDILQRSRVAGIEERWHQIVGSSIGGQPNTRDDSSDDRFELKIKDLDLMQSRAAKDQREVDVYRVQKPFSLEASSSSRSQQWWSDDHLHRGNDRISFL